MTSMTQTAPMVIGGVDTHGDTHHGAVVDQVGRHLADAQVPATAAGYRALLAWLSSHGQLARVGVEGTGAYGAGLARYLHQQQVEVVEVDRPDRKTRRAKGKSDPIDAYAAATAALNGTATGTPKTRDGHVEAIRTLRVARNSAVKSRTQAMNQLRAEIRTAPQELREALAGLSATQLVRTCARLRPALSGADLATAGPQEAVLAAVKTSLRTLAQRHQSLTDQIHDLDEAITPLVRAAAPQLLDLPGVGVHSAAQFLVTFGDNPDRIGSEAAFARLCGVAPIPASSGRTDRHRLNRGGDRAANHALHMVIINRLGHHPPTQAYMHRRNGGQRLSKREVIRCLKRYLAREIYHALRNPQPATKPTQTAA